MSIWNRVKQGSRWDHWGQQVCKREEDPETVTLNVQDRMVGASEAFWERTVGRLLQHDVYSLERYRSVQASFWKQKQRPLLKTVAINFLSLSLQRLSEGLSDKEIIHSEAAFSSWLSPCCRVSRMTLHNDMFASCSALQFTEYVHSLYLICSLPLTSEVCRAGISIFTLQMNKLKRREVIIPKWSSVLWLLIQFCFHWAAQLHQGSRPCLL